MYPDRDIVVDRSFSESSLYFSGSLFGYFGRCIDVAVGSYGIRLSVAVFGVGPLRLPIVLPWNAIESCTPARFGWVGDALRITVRGWPCPIVLGRFLRRYGDVCSYAIDRWRQVGGQDQHR